MDFFTSVIDRGICNLISSEKTKKTLLRGNSALKQVSCFIGGRDYQEACFFLADLSVFIYLNPAMFVSSEDHNETITEKGKWEQIWNGYNEWTESWIDEIEFTTTLTKETRNLGYWET